VKYQGWFQGFAFSFKQNKEDAEPIAEFLENRVLIFGSPRPIFTELNWRKDNRCWFGYYPAISNSINDEGFAVRQFG